MQTLIIIDMLNGFCRPGYPLSYKGSTIIIESYIRDQITKYSDSGSEYFFVCDTHTENASEFKQYPKHCIKGSVEAEIVDTLKEFAYEANTVSKNTLSIYYNTILDSLLQKSKTTEIHISGVLTDICIFFAAYESRNRGYETYVHKSGILAMDQENENFFLDYMTTKLGVTII
jgi:nicotinamidase/pyrazinamidase